MSKFKKIWNDKNFQPVKYGILIFIISVIVGFIVWKSLNPSGSFF